MTEPTLSVCIPTYNQDRYVISAIESALGLDYPNIEIWISDDHSTDQTQVLVEALASQHESIRYVRQPENLGIGRNVDFLLRQPETDYIIRLDSDDLLGPDFAREMVPLMESHPTAGYGHTNIKEIDAEGKHVRDRILYRVANFVSDSDSLRQSVRGYKNAANICIYRRAALLDIDFSNPLLNFAEDYDLSVRLADAGWGNIHHIGLLASYRVWGDDERGRARRHMSMLADLRQLFEGSLAEAYARRGWSLRAVVEARGRYAVSALDLMASPHFNTQEKAALLQQIELLGRGSRYFAFYKGLWKLGLLPGVKSVKRLPNWGKQKAKVMLYQLRRRGA